MTRRCLERRRGEPQQESPGSPPQTPRTAGRRFNRQRLALPARDVDRQSAESVTASTEGAAGAVEQSLAVGVVPYAVEAAAGEQHEAGTIVVAGADQHDGDVGHVRGLEPLGHEIEGVPAGEIGPFERHRHIARRLRQHAKARETAGLQFGGKGDQRTLHVRPHAADVDVQLVLAAPRLGVDGQRQIGTRRLLRQVVGHEPAGRPGIREIVGRIGRHQARILDADRAYRRRDDDVEPLERGPQHRVAAFDAAFGFDAKARE